MSKTLPEFFAGLSKEKRTELTTKLDPLTRELKTLTAKGETAAEAAGKTAFEIRNLLAKSGAAGQVTNYCKEQGIGRTTFYHNIHVYQWSRVPAEFKDMAKRLGKDLDEVAQNRIIHIALGDKPGTVEAAEVEVNKVPAESSDPVADAVKEAAAIIVAAYQGDLASLAALANRPKYEETAKAEIQAMAKNIACTLANTVQGVRGGFDTAVKKHKSLKQYLPMLDAACMGQAPTPAPVGEILPPGQA